jgi:hypothetical protein
MRNKQAARLQALLGAPCLQPHATTRKQMRKHGALQAGAVRHQQAASLQALNGRAMPATTRKQQGGR